MNLKETYDRIATDWHKDHHNDDWWIDGTEKFISLLKHSDNILDVGCGSGMKSKYLSYRELNITGIDFSEKLIEIARKENPKLNFIIMDMYDVEKLEKKFDGIFAQASLLHIPRKDLSLILEKLISKLKDDGILYVAVKGIKANDMKEETKEENDYGYSYKRFFSYHSMDELVNHFQKLGLKIIYQDVKRSGKTDWVQIIGKK